MSTTMLAGLGRISELTSCRLDVDTFPASLLVVQNDLAWLDDSYVAQCGEQNQRLRG